MRRVVLSLLGGAVVASLLGCMGVFAKTMECQSFVNTVNAALPGIEAEGAAAEAAGEDLAKITEVTRSLAQRYRKLHAEVSVLEVTDATLKAKVAVYLELILQMAVEMENMVIALGTLDLPAMEGIGARVDVAEAKESAVIDEINGYCGMTSP